MMYYPALNANVCGILAREVFGSPNPDENKTTAALDREICESLIGVPYAVTTKFWNMVLRKGEI